MKTNPLLLLVFFLFVSLSFYSCGKEEDKEPTKTDLMTAHPWQGEKALAGGFDVTVNPLFADMFPDVKSLTLTFRKDGSYTGTFTDDGQNFSGDGKWSFQDNETTLKFDLLSDFGLSETVTIKELTATRLTITTSVTIPSPLIPGQTMAVPVELYFISK